MPDKRQTSKQRRAARNRAQREALNARRENAVARAASATAGSGAGAGRATGAGTSSGDTTGTAAVSRAGRPARGGLLGMAGLGRGAGIRRPGDLAVLLALVLAIGAFVMLLLYKVPVDDRGEALPTQFGGVALDARSELTGSEVETQDTSIIDAYGAGVIGLMAVPVIVVAVTTVLNRRLKERNRLLTIAMLALAGVVVLTGGFGFFFLPALIALAVGSFQVRKAELPSRAAQRSAARTGRTAGTTWRGRGRDDAIDVDEVDEVDADVLDTDAVDVDEASDVPAADEPPARRAAGRRSRPSLGSRDRRRPSTPGAGADAAGAGADAPEPDVLEADVVEPEVAAPEGDEVDESDPSGPGPGSSASWRNRNRRRRGRPAPVVDNPEIVADEPDADQDADPVLEAEAPAAQPPGPAAPDAAPVAEAAPEPEVDDTADRDDVLAELEEELRREREAEEAADAEERRRP